MINTTIKFIVSVPLLPLILTKDLFKSENTLIKKITLFFLTWVLIGSVWFQGYRNLYKATDYLLYSSGITDRLNNISVRGESMLPTVNNGEKISLHNPKKYQIARGDIISFSNLETSGLNYLKRVIGMSGDQLLLKNGQVYINNQPLKEDYVYHKDSTYGNTFLIDCQPYTIPKSKIAVFGDNRIASTDSRVIGFIDINDVDGVIKTNYKISYASPITGGQLQSVLSVEDFVESLNKKMAEKRITPLHINDKLSSLSQERAKKRALDVKKLTIQIDDLDRELKKANYDYLLAQEVITTGNYNAEQLAKHVLELQPYNLDFLSSSYWEIGVSTAVVSNNQCQIPVINIILGWPTKPNTSQAIIDSWQEETAKLGEIVNHLNELRTVSGIESSDTETIIKEVSTLLQEADRYKSLVLENRWLTEGEVKLKDEYDQKSKEVQKKVADYVRKYSQYITDPKLAKFFENYRWGNREFVDESNRAKDLFSKGKYTELSESANKLLALASESDEKAIGYYWQGLALFNLSRFTDAKASLLSSIQNNPNYAAPYVTLAAVSFQEQDYNQGLIYAQKCVELDDKYGWCHNNLAIAYINLGQKTKAIEEMKIAVSLDPTSYIFNDNLKRMQQ